MFTFFTCLLNCVALPIDLGAQTNSFGVLNLAVKGGGRSFTPRSLLHRRSSSTLELSNAKTYYTVSIDIGNPSTPMDFLIDTGSSDFWVNADPSQQTYFDYEKSSTFQKNDTDSKFEIGFGDHSKASGFWGTDKVSVFGHSFDASFGVAINNTATSQILGIGLQQGESLVKGVTTDGVSFPTYANFPMLLKSNGIIERLAYSLWLDGAHDGNGTLLFGGVDHSKYHGQLKVVPIVNDHSVSVARNPTTLSVILHQISLQDSEQDFDDTINLPVLLDSGSTLCQLPSKFVDSLASSLNGTYSKNLEVYTVDCSSTGTLNFNLSGIEIPVNISDLISPLHVVGGQDKPGTCALGIYKADEGKFVLGDAFLRSAYVVYDLENMEIGIAPAVSATDHVEESTDIQRIGKSIPSAVSAPLYNQTQVATSITSS